MANIMGIRGYSYVEFYVGSAKASAYWYAKALGMQITGYLGPETGARDRASYYLTKNNLKLVITSPIQPDTWEIHSFLSLHGDGVKRWAVEVDNVEAAFTTAGENGAIMVRRPKKYENHHGWVEDAAIKLYDDTELVYFNHDQYNHIFRPGYCEPVLQIEITSEETGLIGIDHIVGNVRENEMNLWANYFNKTMDFETFVDFGKGDISTKYSALLSKVVRTKDSTIKNPINEPFEGIKKSQIEEYLEQYHGSGVQHVAIHTADMVKTIAALRANGVEFLSVPDTYYDRLAERKDLKLREDLQDLRRHGILCDVEGEGYLLQLFTKPIGDRPTFFFEFIQRVGGAQGFGKGNFQSLFESIELDQKLRGNLEKTPQELMPPC